MLRGQYLPGSYTGRTATYLPGTDFGESSSSTTSMTLTLGSSVNPAPAGNNFNITADLNNTGSNNATNVAVAVTLDSSLTYVSSSGTGWTIGVVGQVVTATQAVVGTGAANTITITVTAGNSSASTSTGGSATADNAATATDTKAVTVTQLTQTVTVTDSADPVITGADAFSYTVQVHNSGLSGSGTAKNLSCAVTLDSSLTYVSSSGTGWSIGVSGQVVTATLSSLAVGDANPITINVTTGTGAVTASTSAALTASNAGNASGSQNTTVNLVSKDATSGIYCPASSTEWTNFIARKGLSISAPDGLWSCQEASGNLADSIGSITLTKGGSSQSYQQTVTGWTRKYVLMGSDGAGGSYTSTSASLPDVSASSMLTLAYVVVPSANPAGTRNVITQGTTGTNRCALEVLSTGKARAIETASNAANASNAYTGTNTVRPTSFRHNHTATTGTGFTDSEKLSPTYSASVTGKGLGLGSTSNFAIAGGYAYVVSWYAGNAEVSDADWKATLQALGFTITWS